MNAEIIAIGTELLLGAITDTNSAHIARALRDAGVDLWWMSAVGDNETRIAEAVRRALQRSQIVITTGGLGPTVDDPTRAALALACGRPLEYREELWAQIAARFQRFGRTPSENNRKQAYVPAGALALENPVGTAPCFIVENGPAVLIALPGVPREMEHMLTHAVLPYLRDKFNLTGVIRAKVLRTVGIGESLVDEKVGDLETLSNPTVGLAAHAGQTDIRLTAKAASDAEAAELLAPLEATIRERLGHFIYGEGLESIEAVVARMLRERGETVALASAEGRLRERWLAAEGGEAVLAGADAPAATLTPEAVTKAAEQARAGHQATWGLALSVNLRPEAGKIHLALAGPNTAEARTLGFAASPALAPDWAVTAAVNLLRLALIGRLAG
jgi:competence/damage-inducible protein CinA-like protein